MSEETKTIICDGIKFKLNDAEVLVEMVNNDCGERDVFIPSVFPTGERICAIGHDFCKGSYLTITIDDNISEIEDAAFKYAFADEVVWSSSCKTIPADCFFDSRIKRVTNIENVEVVGSRAFNNFYIRKVSWPLNCKKIPKYCFKALDSISGIEDVEEIGEGAFSGSFIQEFAWTKNAKLFPIFVLLGRYCPQLQE